MIRPTEDHASTAFTNDSPKTAPTSVVAQRHDAKVSYSSSYELIPLQEAFELGPKDVLCARGKEAFMHEGNVRFRNLVLEMLPTYNASKCKAAKTKIVRDIIQAVRDGSPGGGFVKCVGGRWYEVGDRNAREKVGQSFRDLLHTKYRSSTKAKARVRQRLKQFEEHNKILSPGLFRIPSTPAKTLPPLSPPLARKLTSAPCRHIQLNIQLDEVKKTACSQLLAEIPHPSPPPRSKSWTISSPASISSVAPSLVAEPYWLEPIDPAIHGAPLPPLQESNSSIPSVTSHHTSTPARATRGQSATNTAAAATFTTNLDHNLMMDLNLDDDEFLDEFFLNDGDLEPLPVDPSAPILEIDVDRLSSFSLCSEPKSTSSSIHEALDDMYQCHFSSKSTSSFKTV